MDKKIRVDQTDKRFETRITKDRGDNLRRQYNEKFKYCHSEKALLSDRGDTVRKLPNVIDKRKTDQPKLKIISSSNVETTDRNSVKRIMFYKPDKDIEKALKDLEEQRRLKDKNATKLKNLSQLAMNKVIKKDEKTVKFDSKNGVKPLKKENGGISLNTRDGTTDSSNESGKSDMASCVQRRPIIKTIRNDATVYKAVTFVDKKKPTQLQITIPHDTVKKVKQKFTDTVVSSLKPQVKIASSKYSIKEKSPVARKKIYSKRKTSPISPNTSCVITSPPTEVAKWVPSCVNQHTKPYYEAWVNTTLAAISKNSKDNQFYLEQKEIIERYKRALERPFTPDLIYENCNDERYTGRIRVKQR